MSNSYDNVRNLKFFKTYRIYFHNVYLYINNSIVKYFNTKEIIKFFNKIKLKDNILQCGV